jgi:hypothetical protein
MQEDKDEDCFEDPPRTDFHGRKRELLKRGVSQGKLSWEEIREALPSEFMGETELEVFLFTCKNMGIEIVGEP